MLFEAAEPAQDRDVKSFRGRGGLQLVERRNNVSMYADGQSLGVGRTAPATLVERGVTESNRRVVPITARDVSFSVAGVEK